ncbi:MAG: hypothetical protein AAB393_16695, partial [Bacteroidota bacterium]
MRQKILMIAMSTLAVLAAVGQPRNGLRNDEGDPPPFLFFEAVNLVAEDSTKSRLHIHYRIDQNFFVAVKNKDSSSPWNFASRGEILIELFDSLEVSNARSIQKIDIGADNSDRGPPGKKWYQGIASFEVPPGPYKIVFEADDLESERRFIDDKTVIRLKRFPPGSSETSTPLFVEWKSGQTMQTTLTPVGYGPHLLFGKKAAVFVELPISSTSPEQAQVEYEVAATSLLNHSTTVVLAETLAALTP